MRRRLMLTTASALLCAVLAPAAHANIPPPVTKTNTVRLPAYGNVPDGTLTTKLTYQHATASAAASTGNTIGLGKGAVFTLTTCVAYHLQGAAPVSSCADRSVDTRANAATVYTYAPSVTLSGQPGPPARRPGATSPRTPRSCMQYQRRHVVRRAHLARRRPAGRRAPRRRAGRHGGDPAAERDRHPAGPGLQRPDQQRAGRQHLPPAADGRQRDRPAARRGVEPPRVRRGAGVLRGRAAHRRLRGPGAARGDARHPRWRLGDDRDRRGAGQPRRGRPLAGAGL